VSVFRSTRSKGVVLAQFPRLKVASFEQCSDIVGDIQVVKMKMNIGLFSLLTIM